MIVKVFTNIAIQHSTAVSSSQAQIRPTRWMKQTGMLLFIVVSLFSDEFSDVDEAGGYPLSHKGGGAGRFKPPKPNFWLAMLKYGREHSPGEVLGLPTYGEVPLENLKSYPVPESDS